MFAPARYRCLPSSLSKAVGRAGLKSVGTIQEAYVQSFGIISSFYHDRPSGNITETTVLASVSLKSLHSYFHAQKPSPVKA